MSFTAFHSGKRSDLGHWKSQSPVDLPRMQRATSDEVEDLPPRHAEKPKGFVGRQPAATADIALVEPPIDEAAHSNCIVHGADVTLACEGEDLTEPPGKADILLEAPGGLCLLTAAEVGALFMVPEKTVRELIRGLRLPTRDGYVVVPAATGYSAAARRQWAQANGLGEWVILDEAIQEAHNECGIQPDVIRFLLAWNGVLYSADTAFMPTKLPEAYRKQIKRRVRKEEQPEDAPKMIEMISAEWKRRGGLRQLQTLFELTPLPPNPQHRPLDPRWLCCSDLRHYFSKVKGRAQMNHIARILFPDSKLDSVSQGWWRNKSRFGAIDGQTQREPIDGEAHLEQALRFYQARPEKIRKSIKTGIPLWELDSPTRELTSAAAVAPLNVTLRPLTVTLRRGLCPCCGTTTEWVVGSAWTPCECGAIVPLSEEAPPVHAEGNGDPSGTARAMP